MPPRDAFLEGARANKTKAPKPAKTPKARVAASTPSKAASAEANTRNQEGRAAYDKAVLAWLKENTSKSEPQAASKVLKACGGTGLQGRTALTRLIEAGKASFVGRARATKYWAK